MRFKSIIALLATLATTSVADHMDTYTTCGGPCDSEGTFYADDGSFDVNANDGCRSTGRLATLCMDWGNSRGHFIFDGQSKRCLSKTSTTYVECGDPSQNCFTNEWDETACTW